MKARGVIGLTLGFCCSSLMAQQVVVTKVLARADSSMSLPGIVTTGATTPAILKVPTASADLAVVSGLPSQPALYDAALPQIPAAVCTQAFPPMSSSADTDYVFDHLSFRSAAIKSALTHDNLVKMARNFVPGQPLPDAPTYVPLTPRQKFDLFLRNNQSLGFSVGVLIDSFISEASGAYPRFGGGMAGYGQRLGAAAAGEESAAFIGGYLFPTLLHQDPRYFRSHQTGITDRLAYAASRVIIGRSDSGHNVINTSAIASQLVQAAVSNAYIPYRNETVSGTIENALAGLGAVAQAQMLNEFWPDIKQFFARHNPENLVVRKPAPDDSFQIAQK
jgi:hypothetical protein